MNALSAGDLHGLHEAVGVGDGHQADALRGTLDAYAVERGVDHIDDIAMAADADFLNA